MTENTENGPKPNFTSLTTKSAISPQFNIFFETRLNINVFIQIFHILLDSISEKGSNLATFFARENRLRQTSPTFFGLNTIR